MKSINTIRLSFILAVIISTLTSCGVKESKVQYLSGEVKIVLNPNELGKAGDTVIIESSIFFHKGLGSTSSDKVWGNYRGELPESKHYSDSIHTSLRSYQIATLQ